MTNSCKKGKSGEREWAAFLRSMGIAGARRGRQYQGSPESPDVVGIPGLHCEVKRVQSLNVGKALREAAEDCDPRRAVPYVAHRKNRSEWMITFYACDLELFAISLLHAMGYRVEKKVD